MDHEELRKAFEELREKSPSELAIKFSEVYLESTTGSRDIDIIRFASAITFFDAYSLGFAAGFELGTK